MRLVELGLFLMPLVAWLVWRRLQVRGPSPVAVWLLAGALGCLATGLVLFALTHRNGRDDVYVPARVSNGVIVPGVVQGR